MHCTHAGPTKMLVEVCDFYTREPMEGGSCIAHRGEPRRKLSFSLPPSSSSGIQAMWGSGSGGNTGCLLGDCELSLLLWLELQALVSLGHPQALQNKSCFSAGESLDMETLNPCIRACKDTGLASGPSPTGYGNEGAVSCRVSSHFPTRGYTYGRSGASSIFLSAVGFQPKAWWCAREPH